MTIALFSIKTTVKDSTKLETGSFWFGTVEPKAQQKFQPDVFRRYAMKNAG
jgi:hypothetical protein